MDKSTIYSIGHGAKKIGQFISELLAFDIRYLVDVRSNPVSRWHPQFNRAALEPVLKKHGIVYVFAGDALGGRPDDKSCYDANGTIDYELLKEKEYFKAGISRLLRAEEQKIRLAMMCSESKPEDCHRSRLIGQVLLEHRISVNHIVSEDFVKSQEDIKTKVRGTSPGNGLFDSNGESA